MVHISKYPCLRICLFGSGLNIAPFIFPHLCDGVCFQGSWKVTVGGIKRVLGRVVGFKAGICGERWVVVWK